MDPEYTVSLSRTVVLSTLRRKTGSSSARSCLEDCAAASMPVIGTARASEGKKKTEIVSQLLVENISK